METVSFHGNDVVPVADEEETVPAQIVEASDPKENETNKADEDNEQD